MNEYKGSLDASGKRFAIVAARFNGSYVQSLVDGAALLDLLNHLLYLSRGDLLTENSLSQY